MPALAPAGLRAVAATAVAISSLRTGAVLRRIEPPRRRYILVAPDKLSAIRAGLREETSAAGGTAADIFAGFPFKVYGELGSTKWSTYAAYVTRSDTTKPIVVITSIAGGGPGARSAAPVTRQILSQWLHGRPGPWRPGSSLTC